jgi:hypothetical protein
MSEETTETEEVTEEPKGLRATISKQSGQLKDKDAEIADLTTQLLQTAYEDIGLDPSTALGKAIAKEYVGAPNVDALAAYAKEEYDYTFEGQATQSPEGQVIAQGHAALDQIGQTAGSVPVAPTEGGVLAEAEAAGDYATTMAIKGQQMADMMRTKR